MQSRKTTACQLSITSVAVALALGLAVPVQADEGDETLGLVANVPRPAKAQGQPPSWAGKAYRQGVVSVANPYAAEAGARILEQGGNAIDAAVAIAYALNVVEPQSAGVGGGGFMLIHHAASNRTFSIDTREKAPAAATRSMFVGVPNASLQGLAVGVPGMVRGTAMAVERYGALNLAQVLQPAIKLADEGFAATPRYSAVSCNSRSTNSPESAAYFCPGGVPAAVGSLVLNKPLAHTFKLIAQHGADCFYKHMPDKGCDIARGIVEGQQFRRAEAGSRGGSMSYADLEAYQAVERAPVQGSYRGYTIKAMAPPSSGGLTMIQMLKMLERFPLGDAAAGYGFGAPKTAQVMADAMRIAFADRSVWMGDSDFAAVPGIGLLHPTYTGKRGAAIMPGVRLSPNPVPDDPRPYEVAGMKPATRMAMAEPITGPGETTTHFSVLDQHGNMVSYTNTIEASHGIGVFAGYREGGTYRSHGFLLNNELTDFNLAATSNPFIPNSVGFNDVEPGKRPRSSMTPAMIFSPDGKPLVAYGSPGGATIINSVLNVTLNLIDHGMTLQQAIDAPRMSVTGVGSTVSVEGRFPADTVAALRAMGYTVGNPADIGSVQAVILDAQTGKQYGAADSRREGTVIGLPRAQR